MIPLFKLALVLLLNENTLNVSIISKLLILLGRGKNCGRREEGLTLLRRFCGFGSTLLHLEGTVCQCLQTW